MKWTDSVDKIYCGDALDVLKSIPEKSIHCCITSPPYYNLRDYGVAGQLGLEDTPEEYIGNLTQVFEEVRRILTDSGTLWVVIGDVYAGSGKGAAIDPENAQKYLQGTNRGMLGASATVKKYSGYKNKDLIGIPWLLAFSLRAKGWYLRQDIIWHKPNPMPESVTDRCTKSHEYIFLLSKSKTYYFDNRSIQEPAITNENRPNSFIRSRMYNYDTKISRNPEAYLRLHTKNCQIPGHHPHTFHIKRELGGSDELYKTRNKRDVWSIHTKPCKEAHFAVYPEALIEPCALAGCPAGGTILDPFMGSGTTAVVALKQHKHYIGIDLNPGYIEIANTRIRQIQMGGGRKSKTKYRIIVSNIILKLLV